MASKQETDSDTQDIPVIPHITNAKHTEKKIMVNSASQSMSPTPGRDSLDNGGATGDNSSPPPPRQILNRSTTRSSSSSFSESLDPALDPSSLPPPDPWLETGNGSSSSVPQSGGGGTLCRRDGHWFLKLLQAETGRMEGWCQQMEQETKDNQLSEEGKNDRKHTTTWSFWFKIKVQRISSYSSCTTKASQTCSSSEWNMLIFTPDDWPHRTVQSCVAGSCSGPTITSSSSDIRSMEGMRQ